MVKEGVNDDNGANGANVGGGVCLKSTMLRTGRTVVDSVNFSQILS